MLRRQGHGVYRLRRGMSPAEEGQRMVVEGLHPERQAVDARRPERLEPPGLDRRGIGLQGDLDRAADRPVPAHRGDQVGHRSRVHQRRRAAAEEDAGHRAAAGLSGEVGELAHEGGAPPALVYGPGDVAVEVAIGTLGQAERPVDVDPETGVRRRISVQVIHDDRHPHP